MVFEALAKNRIDPIFSLEIAEFNSKFVSVGGAVRQSIIVPITLKGVTLLQAIQLAGGSTVRDPEYSAVQVFRNGSLYQLSLDRLYGDGALQKLRLQDGDHVYVSLGYELDRAQAHFAEQITLYNTRKNAQESAINNAITKLRLEIELKRFEVDLQQKQLDIERNQIIAEQSIFKDRLELGAIERDYVYLTGEFKSADRFPLPFENKAYLADAVLSNGGINANFGDYSNIYLLRNNEETNQITAYHLNAENVANFVLATRMELRPKDIIFVAEQRVTAWNRLISQIIPTLGIGSFIPGL